MPADVAKPVSRTQQFLTALKEIAYRPLDRPGLSERCFKEDPRLGRHWRNALIHHTSPVATLFDRYLLAHCENLGNDVMVMTDAAFASLPSSYEATDSRSHVRLTPRERIVTKQVRLDLDHVTQKPQLLFEAVDDAAKGLRHGLQSIDDLAIAIPYFYLDRRAFLVELFTYATLFVREKPPQPL